MPYLEAVLLLRTDPAAGWDASGAAGRLYLRPAVARDLLVQLAGAGIAAAVPGRDGFFRYAPEPALAAMLDQVVAAYSTDLVRVTELIHSRIDKRAQQFADAFRWRKEP